MYSVSSNGIISLDGHVLKLSASDEKLFTERVVKPWSALAHAASLKHGVPLVYILSIIYAESVGNPNALRVEPSGQTGVGLMQLTSPSLKGGFSDDMLKNPSINIDLGCKALANILKTPPKDLPAVASRYNCGANGDGSPHRKPTTGQNPAWGLCATAGYLERVSAANNAYLTTGVVQTSSAKAQGSLLKPALVAAGAVVAARYLLR